MPSKKSRGGLCFLYNKPGGCKYGANCQFRHVRVPETLLVCTFFKQPGGCPYGSACKFSHNIPETPPTRDEAGDNARVESNEQAKTPRDILEDDFRRWRLLLQTVDESTPIAVLADFLRTANRLVQQGDIDMLERTIKELATPQGVSLIREAIEKPWQWYDTDSQRIVLWRDCIHPLFQILGDPRVMQSLALVREVQTIERVLSGDDLAPRGLFSFIQRLGQKWVAPYVNLQEDGTEDQYLELVYAVKTKLVECRAKEMADRYGPEAAQDLQELVLSLSEECGNLWIPWAGDHLKLVEQRLSMAHIDDWEG
ncbi:hypothetical protein F5Y04DRAFT_279855 [Hypomontagnella monticulosa]|nr:hypothetical protein F5Y04DRAFT_279855 [Hypomontagnella monticulosa]